MSSNFRATLVRGLDCGRKLIIRDEVIGLEIVYPFIQPVIHGSYCVFRTAELEQLQRECALTLKVGTGHMDLWTGRRTVIDVLFNFEIGVRFNRASGAQRSYSGSEIQARKTERHFSEHRAAHGLEHMIVHPDEPRHNAVSVKIQNLSIFGYAC